MFEREDSPVDGWFHKFVLCFFVLNCMWIGTYNNGSSLTCHSCASGTASAAGASTCVVPTKLCASGNWNTAGTSTCTQCPQNTACYGGGCIGSCGSCLAGYSTSYAGAWKCTTSTSANCPAGSGKNLGGGSGCFACAAGKYNNGTSLFCLPPGHYNFSSSQQRCAPGKPASMAAEEALVFC